jgi:glycosyltransferase involved in cell wall biosynthesis
MKLSLIVPAYNEEATVIQLLELVEENQSKISDVEFEVIVIDDGSTDNTAKLIEGRPELYSKFILMAKNGGKGAAVREGLKLATGDYILFQDADLDFHPREYSKLIQPVREFGAEVVVGSRFLAPPYTRVLAPLFLYGNRTLTIFFNFLFYKTFTDIYTGFLLYRRDLLDANELTSNRWEQHAEILCNVVHRSKSQYEVAIGYSGRDYDAGKKIRAYHVIPVLLMIVKMRLKFLFSK